MRIVAIVNRPVTVDRTLATVTRLLSHEGQHSVDVLHPMYERDPSYLPTEEMPTAARFEAYRRYQRLHCATLKGKYEIWRSGLAPDTRARWFELVGHPVRTVPPQVDEADVVVLGMRVGDLHRDIAHTFRGLRLSKGRFVVLVPQTDALPASPASISIGWGHDHSVERLLAAVVPLMEREARFAFHPGRGRTRPPSAVERVMSELSLPFEVVPAAPGAGSRGADLYSKMGFYGADGLAIVADGPPGSPGLGRASRPGEPLGSLHALVFRGPAAAWRWRALFRRPFQRDPPEGGARGPERRGPRRRE